MAKKKAATVEAGSEPVKIPGTPAQAPAVAQPQALISYDWAVNIIKLNRSIAFVQQSKRGLKDEALEAAVKERYEELGGLLREDGVAPKGKKAPKNNVVNMAPDDGSDDADDE